MENDACKFPAKWSYLSQNSCVCSYSVVSDSVPPWTVAHQAPLSMGFSRQEYWSRQLFPSPGDLPNPGIELRSLALQAVSLATEPPEKPQNTVQCISWESNPGLPRGRQEFYHWTTNASLKILTGIFQLNNWQDLAFQGSTWDPSVWIRCLHNSFLSYSVGQGKSQGLVQRQNVGT